MSEQEVLCENGKKTAIMAAALSIMLPLVLLHTPALSSENAKAVLIFLDLLMAGAVVGTFTFSYREGYVANTTARYLGHFTTGALNFAIGLLGEISIVVMWKSTIDMSALFKGLMAFAWFVVFLAVILYDWWDLLRSLRGSNGNRNPGH